MSIAYVSVNTDILNVFKELVSTICRYVLLGTRNAHVPFSALSGCPAVYATFHFKCIYHICFPQI